MVFPLGGIRVLDMSRALAGPLTARLMCDLGADVVKLEPPEGDITRLWGAMIGGTPGFYHQQNVGKRNISVDLTDPLGPRLVTMLAAQADVLIENFRPGVMRKFGLDYAALQAVNPRLVMLSISGFGQEGPQAQRAAYAPTIHAESGAIARQAAERGVRPVDLPLANADTNAGLHGVIAVLAALLLRQSTGRGQHIDLAMIDAMIATDESTHFDLEASHATKAPASDVWETAAGPIVIGGDFYSIWKRVSAVHALELETAADTPRDEQLRVRRAAVAAWLRRFPTQEALVESLEGMKLVWGEVRASGEIAIQPTIVHRGTIGAVDDRAGGTRPIVRSPYRFSDAEAAVRGPAPWLGEHNEQVLREWLGDEEGDLSRWQDVLRARAPGE